SVAPMLRGFAFEGAVEMAPQIPCGSRLHRNPQHVQARILNYQIITSHDLEHAIKGTPWAGVHLNPIAVAALEQAHHDPQVILACTDTAAGQERRPELLAA